MLFFSRSYHSESGLCTLYGVDASHSVLPASLFNKQIFEKVGSFREDLRAGGGLDDSLKSYQGKLDVCSKHELHILTSHLRGPKHSENGNWLRLIVSMEE